MWHNRQRFNSLSFRLPITYGAISLLVALVLGLVLQVILSVYYFSSERDYLMNNASAISQSFVPLLQGADPQIAQQAELFSFIIRARVEVLDSEGAILASGDIFKNRQQALAAGGFSVPIPPNQRDTMPSQQSMFISPNGSDVILFSTGSLASTANAELFDAPIETLPTGAVRVEVFPTFFGYNLSSAPNVRDNFEEHSQQVVEMPILAPDGSALGSLRLSDGPAFGTAILRNVQRGWVSACLFSVAVASVVGWLVSRDILRPLHSLMQATQSMGAGNLSARAHIDRQDEFHTVAESFNEMAQRIEDTIATLQRFISDAAHEINTPITALRTNLDLLDVPSSALDRAKGQVQRLEELTQSLLQLSRLESGLVDEESQVIDLNELLSSVANLYASQAEQKELELVFELAEQPALVQVNPEQMKRAIGNLIHNAVKFTPNQGRIRLSLVPTEDKIALHIRDTGIGIPQEDFPHLFERFYRGRSVTRYAGSGLGLAIAHAIVQRAHGSLAALPEQEGAHFILTLPTFRAL